MKIQTIDGEWFAFPSPPGASILLVWCSGSTSPDATQVRRMKDAYRAYHDKGLEIVTVYATHPGNASGFAKAVADSDLPWPQVFYNIVLRTPIANVLAKAPYPLNYLTAIDCTTGEVLDKEVYVGTDFNQAVARLLEGHTAPPAAPVSETAPQAGRSGS
jgi:hypothetical protein